MTNTKYHGVACKTCRRRGRKCTKELPRCKSCLDKGIECEGYALKWSGMASRGKLAGNTWLPLPQRDRTRAKSTTPKTSVQLVPDNAQTPVNEGEAVIQDGPDNPEDLLNFEDQTIFDFDVGLLLNCERDLQPFTSTSKEISGHNPDLQLSPTSILPASLFDFYNVPLDLKFILNYHVLEVAPKLCVDNATARNPYLQYILPLAVQKPPLLYACAALASSHFNVRLSNANFHLDCLRFRGKAMRRLQEHLWSEETAKDEGNIATIMMLILTDICLGGYSNFEAHFAAAKRLIDLRGSNRSQDNFVEQYAAWLDIMSAASTHRVPVFSSTDVLQLTGPGGGWSYDVFPCPSDQFAVISDVVMLHKSQHDLTSPTAETMSKAEKYKVDILSGPMHNERGLGWLHLTEAYRHAIALYITRLFGCETDEDEISWLTQTVLYHAKMIPPLTGWSDQMLWPLFHAALEIRDERRQNWVRQRIKEMQLSGGFDNVRTALAILEKVWTTNETPDYLSLLSEDGFSNMLVV